MTEVDPSKHLPPLGLIESLRIDYTDGGAYILVNGDIESCDVYKDEDSKSHITLKVKI